MHAGVTSTNRNSAARSSWSWAASSIALLVERPQRVRAGRERRVDRATDRLQLVLHVANHMLPRVPQLVLGPLLRYVGETEAVIWVETDAAARSRSWARANAPSGRGSPLRARALRGAPARHLARVRGPPRRRARLAVAGGLPTERASTPTPRRAAGGRVRLLPRGRAPRAALLAAQGRGRARARDRRAAHPGAAHARRAARALAGRAADDRRPGLRRRGLARRRARSSRRVATPSEPPGEQVLDFEEYTRLYRESWSEPAIRWLFSTVSTAMVFDDHDVHDDWNISAAWVEEMRTSTTGGDEHIVGGARLLLGLPAPRQPRARRATPTTSCCSASRQADDGWPILRSSRARPIDSTDGEPAGATAATSAARASS